MAHADKPRGFRAVTNIGGGLALPGWQALLKSNMVVANGDIFYATVGYATTVITADKAPLGVVITPQKTSITTANPKILFTPALESIVFSGQCSGTPTQARIWTCVDFEGTPGTTTTGGVQEINEDAEANRQLMLIGVSPESSLGRNAELQFIFTKSKFTGKVWGTNGPAN